MMHRLHALKVGWCLRFGTLLISALCCFSAAAQASHAAFRVLTSTEPASAPDMLRDFKSSTSPLQGSVRLEPGSDYWLYIPAKQLGEFDESIRIQPGLIHHARLWFVDPVTEDLVSTTPVVAGRAIPISAWTHDRPQLVFKVPVLNGQRAGLLMQLRMENTLAVSLWAGTEQQAQEGLTFNLLAFAMTSGALLMLAALAMSLWRASNDNGYGWLMISLIALVVLEISIQGLGHFYLWGNYPWLSIRVVSLSAAVFLMAYVGFSNALLRRQFLTDKRVTDFSYVLRVIALLLGLFVVFGYFAVAVSLLTVFAVALSLFYTVSSLWIFRKRLKVGLVFVGGHATLCLIFLLRMSTLYGIDSAGPLTAPAVDDYHYMIMWSVVAILILITMVRQTVDITKNHLRWQKSLIEQMEDQIDARTSDLRKTQAKLKEFAEVHKNFLATMSHELRTPISSIVGLAVMNKNQIEAMPGLHQDFDVIHRMATHTLQIVDEGLNFIRGQGTEAENKNAELDLQALCKDLFSLAQVLVGPNANALRLEACAGLSLTVVTDERKLRQILINLISNATRYCRRGTIILRVRLVQRPSGKALVFYVADTGRGMSMDQIDQFFRPHEKSAGSHGLGLGLALVRRLVDDMGAGLRVRSHPQRGTVFRVRVPLAHEANGGLIPWTTEKLCMDHQAAQGRADLALEGVELSSTDLLELRSLVFSGQISQLEQRLKHWQKACFKPDTLHWLTEAEQNLARLQLDVLSNMLDQQLAQKSAD